MQNSVCSEWTVRGEGGLVVHLKTSQRRVSHQICGIVERQRYVRPARHVVRCGGEDITMMW